ncbi:tetraspanin-5-like [Liolophura sinensis]|uniref:tetraspanin-5-like n=1 Tax=Liolophura sinensis TaxID=3198878 RepID=UPI003158D0DB
MARTRRKHQTDRTEVSCCIKYLVFGFNVFFWILGGAICGIGLWAWTEKDTFTNLSKITALAFDPALIFILAGGCMCIIGFCGCVGALRENTCMLAFFATTVAIFLITELILGILAFVYKDWLKKTIEDGVQKMIVNYRDDPDLQNLIDWVQADWLKCCGQLSYKDWESNIYFNCSSPGSEACGVPFSCCKRTNDVIQNRQCGYDIMLSSHDKDRDSVIYTTGCIPTGEKWLNDNLIPVAGVFVGVAVLQILGICFPYNLRSDILAQREKWSYQN